MNTNRALYGRIKSQQTVDLPISTGTPVEIDCSATDVVAVSGYCSAAFNFVFAANADAALIAIASNATRSNRPAGAFIIDALTTTEKLYIRSAGAAVTASATAGLTTELITG